MCCFGLSTFWFHDWVLWSEPKEQAYYSYDAPPALVPNTKLRELKGFIQDRTCAKCGKYQWRKV